jgi:hypothetical protein
VSKFKRLLLSGLAVLMALVCVTGLISPASAYVTSVARISQSVNTATPLHVDAAVIFGTQNDGTGVRIDWAGLTVNNCSLIGGQSPKHFNNHIFMYDGNTGNLITVRDYADTDVCNPTWTFDRAGYDEGFVKVVIITALRRTNTNARYWFEYVWNVWPSGNSQLLYAGWTNY